jgi:YVTN family beta-propeller protein
MISMTTSAKVRSLRAATLSVLAALCVSGAAQAQYAGSNVTGSHGLVAIDKLGNKIRFYDPKTLAEIKVIDAPEKAVHELTFSYDHKHAYIPIYGDGIYGANANPNHKLLVVDLEKQAIEDLIDLGENLAPHGIVATRDGKLWIVCDRNNRLLLVDPAKKTIDASYDGNGKGAHFITMLPDESKIYLSNKEADMNVFDTRKRAFVKQIPVGKAGVHTGNGSGSESLTVTPNGKRILVADNADNDIRVIDTTTDTEVGKFALKDRAPSNVKRSRLVKLMFSPDGKYLVATTYASGQAWVIDAANYSKQSMISIAKGPQGIAFAPDSKTALVTSQDSGLLTRLDLASGKASGVFDGGTGIEVLAYY